jgi:hypothetical protein
MLASRNLLLIFVGRIEHSSKRCQDSPTQTNIKHVTIELLLGLLPPKNKKGWRDILLPL